jgi:imidazolonepropionase
VARRLGRELPLTVRTTSLGAHALPPEFDRPRRRLHRRPALAARQHAAGLVDAVDVFCDTIGFTPAQTERVFDAARRWACRSSCMPNSSATRAARRWRRATARCRATTSNTCRPRACRHARGRHGGVLLPGAFYFLRETRLPPVQALRDAGVPMAIATDHNPGSSPACRCC